MSRPVTIAVDVVGGDFAPQVVIEGIELALQLDESLHVLAVGPSDAVLALQEKHSARVQAVVTTEIIAMDEHPAQAVRAKKDSSIVVGCRVVKEGQAQGFFSAGSTGACMAAATLGLGRIKGVSRPAIATVLPATTKPTVLTDVGANADCKPEYLVQFALMGQAYASAALGVVNPTVGLLNIGEEETKGSVLAQESYQLMNTAVPNFFGNVEGRDVLTGEVDVIVTDGFTGNVALKLLEGTSKTILSAVKGVMTSSLVSKLCALPLIGGFKRLRKSMDPDQFGGAPLLGVKGVVIIGHGSSNATAISNGILVGARCVRNDLPERIAQAIGSLE